MHYASTRTAYRYRTALCYTVQGSSPRRLCSWWWRWRMTTLQSAGLRSLGARPSCEPGPQSASTRNQCAVLQRRLFLTNIANGVLRMRNSPPCIPIIYLKTYSFHCKLLKVFHGRENLLVPSRDQAQCSKNFKCCENMCVFGMGMWEGGKVELANLVSLSWCF